jgi:5-methylcytosine-specific restriction endonuclease McrA
VEDHEVINAQIAQEFACDHRRAGPYYKEGAQQSVRGVWRQCPGWAAKRDAVILRECQVQGRKDPRCQGCGRAAGTIAHHLTYAHVGAEFLFELALVCGGCHDQLHPERREQSA